MHRHCARRRDRDPNRRRIGPPGLGLLQPFADVFKLLFKEIILPVERTASCSCSRHADPDSGAGGLGRRALQRTLVLADIDAGLLYVLAMTSLGVYGVIFAGWASNSKYAFLGAALGGADRFLRDRHGLRAGRRADGRAA
jgi:NADH-quinone oxidoreductase subunit H